MVHRHYSLSCKNNVLCFTRETPTIIYIIKRHFLELVMACTGIKEEKKRQKRSKRKIMDPKWKTITQFVVVFNLSVRCVDRNFCGYLILRFFQNRKNSQNIVPANNSNIKVDQSFLSQGSPVQVRSGPIFVPHFLFFFVKIEDLESFYVFPIPSKVGATVKPALNDHRFKRPPAFSDRFLMHGQSAIQTALCQATTCLTRPATGIFCTNDRISLSLATKSKEKRCFVPIFTVKTSTTAQVCEKTIA